VIVVIRKNGKQESSEPAFLEAAGGSPLVAYFSKFSKIVIQHSGMAYQTHLLFGGFGVRSNDRAAPRAHNVLIARFFIDTSRFLFRQHDLLCRSVETNSVPIISVLA